MKSRILEISLRLLKFSTTSLLGTAVDTAVLWACSKFLFKSYFGVYLVSPFISFECATIVNFIVAFFYIWKDRVAERSTKSFLIHFGEYNTTCCGAFLIKMGFLLLIERIFSLHVVWCNLIALCISGLLNFFFNEKVIFKKKKL